MCFQAKTETEMFPNQDLKPLARGINKKNSGAMNGVKTPAPTAVPWRATSRRDRTPCLTKEKGLP